MSLWPPEPVRSAYARWTWSVAWEWPDESTTWRLEPAGSTGQPTGTRYLKVVRCSHHPTLADECRRTRWARPYLPVAEVFDFGSDGSVDWLVTAGLAGLDATRHPLREDPARLVPALAGGLAAFHAAAPVDACPFDFTVSRALEHVRRRVATGVAEPGDLHPEHAHFGIAGALHELERLAPDREDLVVCHGDYCLPNLLLDDTGTVTGYVDLGELGIADRWCDIALGAWSVTWNLGPGWEPVFYEAYGVEPDERRIAFFRLLYDLAS